MASQAADWKASSTARKNRESGNRTRGERACTGRMRSEGVGVAGQNQIEYGIQTDPLLDEQRGTLHTHETQLRTPLVGAVTAPDGQV
jgi:hypothetical protein